MRNERRGILVLMKLPVQRQILSYHSDGCTDYKPKHARSVELSSVSVTGRLVFLEKCPQSPRMCRCHLREGRWGPGIPDKGDYLVGRSSVHSGNWENSRWTEVGKYGSKFEREGGFGVLYICFCLLFFLNPGFYFPLNPLFYVVFSSEIFLQKKMGYK